MSYNENYPSKLLADAVEAISSLPGVGRRSALRLALHLLRQPSENVHHFTRSINELRDKATYCRVCRMISDSETCSICSDKTRDHNIICVVENVRDVMSIENTGQYHGVYHVLGGIISPMDGIGPADLFINSLVDRVASGEVKEVILALSTTTDGETTNFFITRKLQDYNIKISTIASGISVGEELEYTDEVTLSKAMEGRNEL